MQMTNRIWISGLCFFFISAASAQARADQDLSQSLETSAPPRQPVASPSPTTIAQPYSAPWMMRPLLAGSGARIDDTLASYNDHAGHSGTSNVTLITGSYRAWRNLQLSLKLGMVESQPTGATSGVSPLNGVIGSLYSFELPLGFHLTPSLGISLPWGAGGGDHPSANLVAANKAGALNRQALEGSIFGVDYLAINPGLTAGWIGHGVTVQADAQLFESSRVRGTAVTEPDHYKTNFWSGLHLGYFFIPQLSIGSEVHYQRYLSTPVAVVKDPAARDTVSGSIGLRGHLRTMRNIFKPGISYTQTVVGQGAVRNYRVVQVELAVAFR